MTRPLSILRPCAVIVAGGLLLGAAPPPAPEAVSPPSVNPATAAILNVSPIRIEIESADNGATVRLTNGSGRELPVQSRIFAWSQTAGEDVYAPSTDMIVSPSISSIPAGQTQVVRVLRKTPASPGEKRFRLVVDQLPDLTSTSPGQAKTRIRFTIPVFVDRDKAAPAKLDWRLGRNGLQLANSGGMTARILDLQVKGADGKDIPMQNTAMRYVLGNSTITWPIGNGCALGQVRMTAQIDGQAVDGLASPSCG